MKVRVKMLHGRAGERETFKAGGEYLIEEDRATTWAAKGICTILTPPAPRTESKEVAPTKPEREVRTPPPAVQEKKKRGYTKRN